MDNESILKEFQEEAVTKAREEKPSAEVKTALPLTAHLAEIVKPIQSQYCNEKGVNPDPAFC